LNYKIIDEQDLIAGCKIHNRIAQKCLFDKFAKPIFNSIVRIVNDYDAANDILQDTFIDVFRYLKDFKAESSVKTWITTIAIRNAIRYLKKCKNFDSIDDHHNIKTIDWNVDFTAEYLDKAIKSLPDKARAIFVAYEIEGYQHNEIAKMFEISEGTSKSTLNYSKKLLQIKLKELYEK
jgi:RNA polymerase sigma factor (sigma-70 family)